MIKKLGDLTIKEVIKLQDKICTNEITCKNCPFTDCCIDTKKIDLNIEIEVEDNSND